MHLAILGICAESRELAEAAAAGGHRVTWYLTEAERRAAADLPCEPQEAWEYLLDAPAIDGVVLSSAAEEDDELRSEQWRRLAQSGARMLIVHPVVDSLLVYLEVDMLARESGGLILPYWPDAYSESARRLEAIASGADYGFGRPVLELACFRRHLHDRSPRSVTKWFARDAALVDLLAGPFSEIGALGPDASEAAYAALGVHLHGPRGIPVRWEVARAQEGEQGELTAEGSDSELRFDFDGSGEPLRAVIALERMGQPSLESQDRWLRCVRAMELADSIEISLRRGRMIEVHYRPMSEETSYKGMMSAVGCFLLLLAPLMLVLAAMLQAVFGWRLMRFWYVPVLVVFVGFLMMQLVARIAARPADESPRTRLSD